VVGKKRIEHREFWLERDYRHMGVVGGKRVEIENPQ
jgi:hypothetical protein